MKDAAKKVLLTSLVKQAAYLEIRTGLGIFLKVDIDKFVRRGILDAEGIAARQMVAPGNFETVRPVSPLMDCFFFGNTESKSSTGDEVSEQQSGHIKTHDQNTVYSDHQSFFCWSHTRTMRY